MAHSRTHSTSPIAISLYPTKTKLPAAAQSVAQYPIPILIYKTSAAPWFVSAQNTFQASHACESLPRPRRKFAQSQSSENHPCQSPPKHRANPPYLLSPLPARPMQPKKIFAQLQRRTVQRTTACAHLQSLCDHRSPSQLAKKSPVILNGVCGVKNLSAVLRMTNN